MANRDESFAIPWYIHSDTAGIEIVDPGKILALGANSVTWAWREASDVQAPFAGISYVVFGSWDLVKPLSSPT